MSKTVHAFGDDVLAHHDAVELARLLRTRAVGADEVERAAIERARKVDPTLHAVQLAMFDAPRRNTELGDMPLAGVPTFVKDTFDLAGLPTNLGSEAVRARPARRDDPFAKQLLGQGLVVLGKSTMPELGFNASTEYQHGAPTRNPWHTDHSSGASSGGSAALVAAGVVPLAHGNDGGGSVRIPAACCGLVGLKPTRGRLIVTQQARSMPVQIVSEGVMTRSVRDTAHFYAGAERIFHARKLPRIGLVEGPNKRRLRVGVVHDSVLGHLTDDETRAAVARTAERLSGLGHRVADLVLPAELHGFAVDFSIYWGMLAFFAENLGRQVVSPDFDKLKLDNLSRGLSSFYRKQMHKTPGVIYRLHRSAAQYAAVFSELDVVLSPVVAHTTPRLGHLSPAQPFEQLFDKLLRFVSFTPLNNATGGPGIALPVASSAAGLPIGIHLSAAHGAERTLLELAYELEAEEPWRRIQDAHLTT